MLPKLLDTGLWGNCHIQGIAVDEAKGFIYYSFTTKLVKARLQDGEIVGTADGLLGHMGCIDFDPETGYVFGSLEYKHDIIGKGVLEAIGKESGKEQMALPEEDAFYMAIFDVDRIDRMDMDAVRDGIMRAAWLPEVVSDYRESGLDSQGRSVPHRYGCSGIDGTAIAPSFQADGTVSLLVAYGIYSDLGREDNNHQIILEYSRDELIRTAMPLSQRKLHHSGPEKPLGKYFVYTGNTEWGIQNLEYDPVRKILWAAVYPGFKPEFPNFSLFAFDMKKAPVFERLRGLDEKGWQLSLKESGLFDAASGVWGYQFPHGSTGLYVSPGGDLLISEHYRREGQQGSLIRSYQYDGVLPFSHKEADGR